MAVLRIFEAPGQSNVLGPLTPLAPNTLKLSFSTGKFAAFHCRKLLYNWLKVYVFEDVAFNAHEGKQIQPLLSHCAAKMILCKFQPGKRTLPGTVGHHHAHKYFECDFNIGKHRFQLISNEFAVHVWKSLAFFIIDNVVLELLAFIE